MKGKLASALSALFRKPDRIALAVVVGGVVARCYLFLLNRSFWIDEAKLALNVVQRSYVDLLGPLDMDQAAPLGFLMMSKAMIGLFGNSDLVLRTMPLLAGCLGLFLMYRLAFLILPPLAALLSVVLFTLGQFVLYYATEFKQYSCDLAIGLFLSFLAVQLVERRPPGKGLALLGVSGAVAIPFSFPAIFVLGGVAGSLFVHYWRQRDRKGVIMTSAIALVWGVVFGALTGLTLQRVAANNMLQSYWADAFMPLPPWGDPGWLPVRLTALFINPAGFLDAGPATALMYGVLFIAGMVSLWRRKCQTGLLFLLPLMLALGASALHRYPFSDRLMLWAVPGLVISTVEGVWWLVGSLHHLPNVRRIAWIAVTGVLLAAPLRHAAGDVLRPKARQHIKPLLAHFLSARNSHDLLYVYHKSRNPFLYYYPFYRLTPSEFILGGNFPGETERYVKEIKTLSNRGRLWLLFSYVSSEGGKERDQILRRLIGMGRIIDERYERSASLHLFQMR